MDSLNQWWIIFYKKKSILTVDSVCLVDKTPPLDAEIFLIENG